MVAGKLCSVLRVAIMHVCSQCGVQAGKRAAGGESGKMDGRWWGKLDVGSILTASSTKSFGRYAVFANLVMRRKTIEEV